MTSRWILIAFATGAIIMAAAPAFAQANFPNSSSAGSTGSSGLFGSRSVGGSVSAGNRTTTGSSASGGLMNQENAGQLDGSERYMRGNRQGAFVGADSADASALGQQQGQMGGNQFQQNQLQQMLGMNRNQQAQMMNQQGQGQNGANGRNNREIRAILQVDFDTPALAPGRVAAQAQKVLVRAKPLQGLGTIQVGMQGRLAVLSGTVHSERARKLAEQLVLLEPGISGVQNDLQVSPPPAPPAR
jgi:hypothetical protein